MSHILIQKNLVKNLTLLPFLFLSSLFCFFDIPSSFGQQVAVIGDVGQAYLIKHGGNCYALLPSHVTRRSKVSLVSSSPVFHGYGKIYFRTDKATDLALAYVQGPITKRCVEYWKDLPREIASDLEAPKNSYILIIHENGASSKIPVTIVHYNHYEITVVLKKNQSASHIRKGMSGAMLIVNNKPVGIILKAANTKRLYAYRMDEAILRLQRWLDGAAGQVFDRNSKKGSNLSNKQFKTGFPLHVTFYNTPGITPEFGIENLQNTITQSPYIAIENGQPITFTIDLGANKAKTVKSITVVSKKESEKYAIPKRIRFRVDASKGKARYWRTIYSPEMPPNGFLKFSTGGISVKHIEITIDKTWEINKPLRIDRILIE